MRHEDPSSAGPRPAPYGQELLPQPPRFRLPERYADVALIVLLALPGIGVLIASIVEPGDLSVPFAILALATVPALWWRRRWSLEVLAFLLVMTLVAFPAPVPAAVVALYTVASRTRFRQAIVAAVATAACIVAARAIHGAPVGLETLVPTVAWTGAVTAIGLYVGARRNYIAALRQRAIDLQRERELLADHAVAEERARIARELHDVVAHHVSLMVVQAGGLEETLSDAGPKDVAHTIGTTGREALGELRRLLGVLRPTGGNGGDLGREPQPGVRDLRRLVEQTQAAGVPVRLEVDGSPRPLSAGVDLSVYRIAQEALTNVIKHAGPAHATVTLRYRPDAIELLVTDDGRGSRGAGAGEGGAAEPHEANDGHGLLGMRERVALFGGRLVAEPVPDGGFAVRAVFPLEPAEA